MVIGRPANCTVVEDPLPCEHRFLVTLPRSARPDCECIPAVIATEEVGYVDYGRVDNYMLEFWVVLHVIFIVRSLFCAYLSG